MRPTAYKEYGPFCGVYRTAILQRLTETPTEAVSFAELREETGVPDRTLTHHLRVLEDWDFAVVELDRSQRDPTPTSGKASLSFKFRSFDLDDTITAARSTRARTDYTESPLTDAQRIGELETRVQELQSTVAALCDALDAGDDSIDVAADGVGAAAPSGDGVLRDDA